MRKRVRGKRDRVRVSKRGRGKQEEVGAVQFAPIVLPITI